MINKILFSILPFIVGFLFFLAIGCGVSSFLGGFLFVLFAMQDYHKYYPIK